MQQLFSIGRQKRKHQPLARGIYSKTKLSKKQKESPKSRSF